MRILSIIYIISFILLFLSTKEERNYSFLQYETNKLKVFKSKDANSIANALLTGNKRNVRVNLKKDFKVLNILHLMTPSGLHLGSLLLIISSLFKKDHRKKKFIFIAILCISIQFLEKFYSLKRVALYTLLYNLFPKQSRILLFFTTFIVDFIRGSYFSSPLSYTYSFLFWGVILMTRDRVNSKIGHLIFSQILLSLFTEEKFYLLGSIIGIGITGLFSLIFIPTILISVIPLTNSFGEIIIKSFIFLVQISAAFAKEGPSFYTTLSLVLVISMFIWTRKWGWLVFSLLISSQPLINFPKRSFRITSEFKNNQLIDYGKPNRVKYRKRGYYSWYSPKIKCRTTMYSYFYKRKCRTYR